MLIGLNINALILNCNYSVVTWSLIGASYTCTGTFQFVGDDRNVTEVRGNHTAGNNNSNVLAIALSNQLLENGIPTSLERFFPNLTVLSISNAGLAQVSRSDLVPFRNLQALILFSNQLESLDGDLFVNTPLLQYINLGSNHLRNLGANIFNPLRNLRTLRLGHNVCIDGYVDNNATVIEAFKWEASFRCPPAITQIERDILNGEKFRKIIETLESRISDLENLIFLPSPANIINDPK